MTAALQQSMSVSRNDNCVLVTSNGQTAGMSWDVALAFAEALSVVGRSSRSYAEEAKRTGKLGRMTTDRETVKEIVVKAAGPAIIVELKGNRWFECNYRQIPQLVQAIKWHGHRLEEIAKAQQLIEDEAILNRLPIPVGLAYNRKIKKEAWKAAEYVKLPDMVEPQAVFYPPTIIQHPPTKPTTDGE